MSKFIKVTDAITGNHMLIKTDIIATVEKSIKTSQGVSKAVSKITFVDNRPEEYAEESLKYFEAFLCFDS